MRRKIGSTTLSGLKFGVAMQLKSCSVYAKEQIALDFVQVAQAAQTHLIPLSMLKKE
jgi:ATP-dependent Clp protease adapter protein ClpS